MENLKKDTRKFYGYIWYFKLHYFFKKQRIMGVLESITAFHENRDRHTLKRSVKGCRATITRLIECLLTLRKLIFINYKIEEMYFCKKLSFEKIIYFLFMKACLVLKIVDRKEKFRKSVTNIFIEGHQDLRVETVLFTKIFS